MSEAPGPVAKTIGAGGLALEQKLRAAHVKRWHIINTYREQTVAEHSFLVSILAIEISRKVGYSNNRGGPFNTEKEWQIMRWAMWHDLPEVITGDPPTPIKATLRQVAGFNVYERVAPLISEEYATIKRETYSPVKDIVKLADLIEARDFLKNEGKGKHAHEVVAGIHNQILDHVSNCRHKHMMYDWGALETLIFYG
jgi:5'-deoxynucleotidase